MERAFNQANFMLNSFLSASEQAVMLFVKLFLVHPF